MKFLVTCRDTGVFLKFTEWKNVNKNDVRFKNKFYRMILLDEVNKKQNSIKVMKKDFKTAIKNLLASITLFKRINIKEINQQFCN